jgi:hypothetical protein
LNDDVFELKGEAEILMSQNVSKSPIFWTTTILKAKPVEEIPSVRYPIT